MLCIWFMRISNFRMLLKVLIWLFLMCSCSCFCFLLIYPRVEIFVLVFFLPHKNIKIFHIFCFEKFISVSCDHKFTNFNIIFSFFPKQAFSNLNCDSKNWKSFLKIWDSHWSIVYVTKDDQSTHWIYSILGFFGANATDAIDDATSHGLSTDSSSICRTYDAARWSDGTRTRYVHVISTKHSFISSIAKQHRQPPSTVILGKRSIRSWQLFNFANGKHSISVITRFSL